MVMTVGEMQSLRCGVLGCLLPQDVNEKIIRELREEIEVLRQQLQRVQAQTGGDAPPEKVMEMEEMIANLQRAKENVRYIHADINDFARRRYRLLAVVTCRHGRRRSGCRDCTRRSALETSRTR